MIEQIFRSGRVVRRVRSRALGPALEDLVEYLLGRGYSKLTIQRYVGALEHFDGWLRRGRRATSVIDEALIQKFLHEHVPRCRCPPPRNRMLHDLRASLDHLLIVLRQTGRVTAWSPPPKLTPAETLVRSFVEHVRRTLLTPDARANLTHTDNGSAKARPSIWRSRGPLTWYLYGATCLAVEKRTPHYALDSIKATFTTAASLRMTRTAQDTAFSLGLFLADVVRLIQGMTREQFYKSMTAFADHRIWQDVYHVPFEGLVLYVKFTTDAQGYLVISFKEK